MQVGDTEKPEARGHSGTPRLSLFYISFTAKVNFMCQLDWATGCLAIGPDIFPGVSGGCVSDRDEHLSRRLPKGADLRPPLKACIEQKAE